MTQRIYLTDPAAAECKATVLDCITAGDGFEVLLSATVIFPEGGGQPSDVGSIDRRPVSHAREQGEDVWHLTDMRFDVGAEVTVKADMAVREDHSAQHTGEHMVSGLASIMYGAKNVGFHMAEDYSTLDLDIQLDDAQLAELERAANAAVMKDIPVTSKIVTEAELETLTLRKKAGGLTGDIRIIYIDGVDSCTCCGTHCASTGRVGSIRLQDATHYKGGTRIWLLCGMRAVTAARLDRTAVRRIAARMSVGDEDAVEAVLRQGDELTALRRQLKQRTDALLTVKAGELIQDAVPAGSAVLITYYEQGLDAQELKLLADKLRARPDVVAALFSTKGDTLYYQLARGENAAFSMKTLCAAVNAALGGRGGGREDMAQGSAKAGPGQTAAIEQLHEYMKKAISAQ